MSPPGRPKGEFRRAQPEGSSVSDGRNAHARELDRQQALVRTLLQTRLDAAPMEAWVDEREARLSRALNAYRANAGASAERALGSSFPTVLALMGDEAFAAMARAFWQARPPSLGDLAQLGKKLPEFMALSEQLRDEPYLPDCARLDWLLACAEGAVDASPDPASLSVLAEAEPEQLQLRLMPSVQLLLSEHPVLSIWQAHRDGSPGGFAQARAALQHGEGTQALVWREGWRGMAVAISLPDWRFTQALLEGLDLASALNLAGANFDFGAWLATALQRGWLLGVYPG